MAYCRITVQKSNSHTSRASFTGTFEECLENCKTHVNEDLMWMLPEGFITKIEIIWVPTQQPKETPNV